MGSHPHVGRMVSAIARETTRRRFYEQAGAASGWASRCRFRGRALGEGTSRPCYAARLPPSLGAPPSAPRRPPLHCASAPPARGIHQGQQAECTATDRCQDTSRTALATDIREQRGSLGNGACEVHRGLAVQKGMHLLLGMQPLRPTQQLSALSAVGKQQPHVHVVANRVWERTCEYIECMVQAPICMPHASRRLPAGPRPPAACPKPALPHQRPAAPQHRPSPAAAAHTGLH